MKFLKTALTTAMLAGALIATPAVAQDKGPLKVGLLLSLSGPGAVYGIPERDAVQVLADDINKKGGVNGRKIELFVYDEATNPTESARGIVELIQRDKVVAVIGSSMGSGTLAAGPSAARFQVPIVAPNGTISITNKSHAFYPWVFRTMTNDLITTREMFARATAKGAKKVAVMHQEDAYGKETADYIQNLAKAKGIEVVAVASAPMKAIDVVAQATRLRNAAPDVVLMQVAPVGLASGFLRAAKQVGLNAPIWGSMALGYQTFLDTAKDAAEGMHLVLIGNWDEPTPELTKLSDMMKAAGKKPEGFAELLTTNGIIPIVEAAKTIDGELTGAKMRDALEKLCGVKTFTSGKVCYSKDNHDGWDEELLVTVVVKDGKFKTVK
ncbi:MAG: ABC transporter substrate-binding protein [Pseudolabrys sp.]|nr:ABC transporter substrate-binding protein [Pseudolabrys sp.]